MSIYKFHFLKIKFIDDQWIIFEYMNEIKVDQQFNLLFWMEFEDQFFKRKVFLYIIFYNEKNLTTLFCSQINFFKIISKHIFIQLESLFNYELKTIVRYDNFCFKN